MLPSVTQNGRCPGVPSCMPEAEPVPRQLYSSAWFCRNGRGCARRALTVLASSSLALDTHWGSEEESFPWPKSRMVRWSGRALWLLFRANVPQSADGGRLLALSTIVVVDPTPSTPFPCPALAVRPPITYKPPHCSSFTSSRRHKDPSSSLAAFGVATKNVAMPIPHRARHDFARAWGGLPLTASTTKPMTPQQAAGILHAPTMSSETPSACRRARCEPLTRGATHLGLSRAGVFHSEPHPCRETELWRLSQNSHPTGASVAYDAEHGVQPGAESRMGAFPSVVVATCSPSASTNRRQDWSEHVAEEPRLVRAHHKPVHDHATDPAIWEAGASQARSEQLAAVLRCRSVTRQAKHSPQAQRATATENAHGDTASVEGP
ncbi:hypothetical protein DCS_02145 [Drechmeria coniospora]|uniref:Uncharacterized protein n=1 Tax=Drechmeria coniospora TaxID=98403 RepID=A0A151GV65_DRECN|nr:hypothetical protein DCS_02145 [Drechmeria coniospora]KYK61005.1 hypothetical protein DCS_02145 [Drechmeria coniospora]